MVLLGERLRQNGHGGWKPPFREKSLVSAAFSVRVYLRLYPVQHHFLALLARRVHTLAPGIFLQGILGRNDEDYGIWVLVVVEYHLVDVLRAVRKRILEAFRAVLLAVSGDEQGLEPADYPEVFRVIHIAHVTRMQPSVHHSLGGG